MTIRYTVCKCSARNLSCIDDLVMNFPHACMDAMGEKTFSIFICFVISARISDFARAMHSCEGLLIQTQNSEGKHTCMHGIIFGESLLSTTSQEKNA